MTPDLRNRARFGIGRPAGDRSRDHDSVNITSRRRELSLILPVISMRPGIVRTPSQHPAKGRVNVTTAAAGVPSVVARGAGREIGAPGSAVEPGRRRENANNGGFRCCE